jgi:hypothetical protein
MKAALQQAWDAAPELAKRWGDAEARGKEELEALRKDAMLGRFVRQHMTECHGGWAIAQTFIPGAPSLEDVTDALPALGDA